MKRVVFSTLALLAFLVISCQREYILEDLDSPLPVDPTQPTDPDSISSEYGGLLTQTITYENIDGELDSIVMNYLYNEENRLAGLISYSKGLKTLPRKITGYSLRSSAEWIG